MSFWGEYWDGFRPYLLKFLQDFSVGTCMYLGVYLLRLLTRWLPITGWFGKAFESVHSLGMIGALAIFMFLFVNDIIQLKRKK